MSKVKKYRKKSVVIEAVLWDGSQEAPTDISNINGGKRFLTPNNQKILIKTLEGEMTADLGDYVIKGVKGELYPCKPDIFEATYEAVL